LNLPGKYDILFNGHLFVKITKIVKKAFNPSHGAGLGRINPKRGAPLSVHAGLSDFEAKIALFPKLKT
jgi:hypothetical protein